MDKQIIIQKAELLKAISNPVRLCLVKHLNENEYLNVSFFTNCMEVSQSSISQHLIKLKDIGILASKQEGKNVNYFIKNKEIKKIIDVLFKEEVWVKKL